MVDLMSSDVTTGEIKDGETPPLGLRERNKLDKLRRIKQAASELFTAQGYDATTTREIAARADVGLGTLFSYAQDKRDLLYLIFNDDLEETVDASIAELDRSAPIEDSLIFIFRALYEFFGLNPRLSRFMLRELTFFDTSPENARYQRIRDQVLEVVVGLVREAQSRGEIRPDEDGTCIARGLFYIYQAEIRRWVASENLDVDQGTSDLRALFQPILNGLAAR